MAITKSWEGFGLTDIGLVRQTNQDTLLLDNELGLWIVADGMGGHAGGDVASQLAVETIHQYIADHAPSTDQGKSMDCAAIIQSAVVLANATIRKRAKAEPALKGMGTTVVLVFMPDTNDENAFIAHVGDSRIYLIRDKTITALTRDHTLLEERIQVGLLPKTTSSSHPLGHVLTRSVGVESTADPEIAHQKLQPTDEILLCSDGLIKMMNDDQILEVLHKNSNQTEQEKCQALVDRANELGGKDNTTVILIQVQEIL
jgi:protein phosphatase